MTLTDTLLSEPITTPAKLDYHLSEHIKQYVAQNSFVKLEAALSQMVYSQFENHYDLADNKKPELERKIEQYIPSRQQLKAYLAGESICYRYANTLANFFHISYALNNHDPLTDVHST